MSEATVVLGIREPGLQEEVLHFLDRLPRVRVLAAAGDPASLVREIKELRPRATVVTPSALAETADLDGAAVLVVAEEETTATLRSAIRAGARGFYLWPKERERLASDVLGSAGPAKEQERHGQIVAVYGPRGGAGATFLSTNLAGFASDLGARTALVDLDLFYADVAPALGVTQKAETRTVGDLVSVLDEITLEHLERVLYQHPRGFQALLAPLDPMPPGELSGERVARAAEILSTAFDLVVLHLPREMSSARPGIEIADVLIVVLTLDVLAFRDARTALSYLKAEGLDPRVHLVVNRASRTEDVIPEDADRVFGMLPTAVVPNDRSVPWAQNRGQLIAGSSRAARRVRSLAERLVKEQRAG
jgi:pilus assembly protein CpaE